ncbi:MAG: hypothetical protein HOV87_23370 [Catenulispora sp.]|nr:hypothetical protein [Catenulispora sp.]
MTDIEEKLTGILNAEADRHDIPVFSAQRIAENAVRKGFWRQRRVLLLAAIGLAGLGGAGGAVVSAVSHGEARVTVTFQAERDQDSNPSASSFKPEDVRTWILGRAKADGLRDVEVTVRRQPLAVTITGRASDTERLKMLGMPADLFFAEMGAYPAPGETPLPPSKCVEKQDIGPDLQICDQHGYVYSSSGSADDNLTAAAAQAVHRGPGPRDWAVVIHLDAATTRSYSAFTGDRAAPHERITVLAGSMGLAEPIIDGRVSDGVIESEAAFTEQQAKALAVDLLSPSPPGLYPPLLTVTVSPARSS